jgi:hypothetical protein
VLPGSCEPTGDVETYLSDNTRRRPADRIAHERETMKPNALVRARKVGGAALSDADAIDVKVCGPTRTSSAPSRPTICGSTAETATTR